MIHMQLLLIIILSLEQTGWYYKSSTYLNTYLLYMTKQDAQTINLIIIICKKNLTKQN